MRKNANIFARPKLKNQHSKNIFDMSFKNVFSAPLGALIPCGTWLLNPDDKVRIGNVSQTVVPEMTRPTFMRLKQHIDYFVVPMSLIWSPFDQFITQQNDFFSAGVLKGYGQSLIPTNVPMFDATFLNELYTANAGRYDQLGYSYNQGSMRLLDMLNYGNYRLLGSNITGQDGSGFTDTELKYNFFNLCAYQRIYYDYYRNNQYQQYSPYFCNIDDLQRNVLIQNGSYAYEEQTPSDFSNRWREMFQLRYRWSKRDYFSNVQPTTLANNQLIGFNGIGDSMNAFGDPTSGNHFGGFGVPGMFDVVNTDDIGVDTTYQGRAISIATSDLTLPQIRLAFAYDKYLRRLRAAGQDYHKQMLAVFGVAPVDEKHGRAFRVGGFTNRISAQTQTATSADGLGEIGGLINSYSDNPNKIISYHAKNHCVLMAVCSYSVDTDYSSNAIARENFQSGNLDYHNPYFENMGLEWLMNKELHLVEITNGDTQNAKVHQNYNNVIGLVPRYMNYKAHKDEIHGRFTKEENLSDFIAWVTQYQDYGRNVAGGVALSSTQLLENPRMLDAALSVQYDGTIETDPFTVNMFHRVSKISAMSVYGEDF